MLRSVGKAIAVLLVVTLAGGGGVLAWAHAGVRRERAPLPSIADAVAAVQGTDGPVRWSIANTASQQMPRSGVLDASRHPAADTRHGMIHPSFILEWADERILLGDTGMDRADAERFGRLVSRDELQLAGSHRPAWR